MKHRFLQKYEKVSAKLTKQRERRLCNLVYTIMKAYALKQKEMAREDRMVVVVRKKLKGFKQRRLFNAMLNYSNWELNWTSQVKATFDRNRLK